MPSAVHPEPELGSDRAELSAATLQDFKPASLTAAEIQGPDASPRSHDGLELVQPMQAMQPSVASAAKQEPGAWVEGTECGSGHASIGVQTEDLWIFYNAYLSPKVIVIFLFAVLLIWSFGWLYIGGTWDPSARTGNLKFGVLNCDTGIDASLASSLQPPALRAMLQQPLSTSLLYSAVWNPSSAANALLDWYNFTCDGGCSSPSAEAQCHQQLTNAVDSGDAWGYLYFPANTSTAFLHWFPAYTPAGSYPVPPFIQYVYGKGRSYSTYSFLSLIVQGVAAKISLSLGQVIATTPALEAAVNSTFLLQPLQLQQLDLHPVALFGQNMASYVICVLMWLGASFSAALSHQYKTPIERRALNTTGSQRPSRLQVLLRVVLIKGSSCYLVLLLLSILLHCIIFACGQGAQAFSLNAGYSIAFCWYMSWSFFSINAFLLHLLGAERFTSLSAFLMILQLMSSGGILAEQLSNPFFYIGRGLPFYYGVRGLRTIFFGGLENVMYINWLVLTAWNVLTGIPSMWFVTRKIFRSGETARPHYLPISVITDAAASWGMGSVKHE